MLDFILGLSLCYLNNVKRSIFAIYKCIQLTWEKYDSAKMIIINMFLQIIQSIVMQF